MHGVCSLHPVWDGASGTHVYSHLKHINGLMAQLPWIRLGLDLKDNWLEDQASLTNEDGSQTLKCWQYFKGMDGFLLNRNVDIKAIDAGQVEVVASLRNRSERLPAIKLEREFEVASKKLNTTPATPTTARTAEAIAAPPPPADDGRRHGEVPPLASD